MSWEDFTALLRDKQPHYYLTQIAAPTLTNDMYGVFLAKSLRAVTIGFGTHVTPMGAETLRAYPALDFVLRGEPEASLRELIDTLETTISDDPGKYHLFDPVKGVTEATRTCGRSGQVKVGTRYQRTNPAGMYGEFPPHPISNGSTGVAEARDRLSSNLIARLLPMTYPFHCITCCPLICIGTP
jgi:hypothetical protein